MHYREEAIISDAFSLQANVSIMHDHRHRRWIVEHLRINIICSDTLSYNFPEYYYCNQVFIEDFIFLSLYYMSTCVRISYIYSELIALETVKSIGL